MGVTSKCLIQPVLFSSSSADQQSHSTGPSDDTPGSKYLQDEAQQAGKSKESRAVLEREVQKDVFILLSITCFPTVMFAHSLSITCGFAASIEQ